MSNRYGGETFAVTVNIHKELFSPLSLTRFSGIFLPLQRRIVVDAQLPVQNEK